LSFERAVAGKPHVAGELPRSAPPMSSVLATSVASSSVSTSLNSAKQQEDVALKAHVASVCYKCFRCFTCMLQAYVSSVSGVSYACYKCFMWMLHVLPWLYTYVVSVLF
jgi:hypothetical protein